MLSRVRIAAVLVWLGAPLLCVLLATPAAAQSTYIGGSLVGDIARFGKVEPDETFLRLLPPDDSSIDGETLGFGITAGRALGEQWGVELEFVRSGGDRESRHETPRADSDSDAAGAARAAGLDPAALSRL